MNKYGEDFVTVMEFSVTSEKPDSTYQEISKDSTIHVFIKKKDYR